MAQKTNLNVSPYYDDFNSENNYYKILFSPRNAVQTRELNSLQSQLQQQIESFGSHIFKDGSMVIPGGLTYDSQFYAVKLNPRQFGTDIGLYVENFIGTKIVGSDSSVSAIVNYVVFPESSDEVEYITIYVKYIEGNNNNEFAQFSDGESLYATSAVTYGNSTISAGTPFATVIPEEGTAVGCAAHINRGVYFIRGFFTEVAKQTIILDYYSNTPSYKIGLNVNEEIITAKQDPTLYDNAKGFPNYAAPGADRFKISLVLDKRTLDDLGDPNFVELMRLDGGEVKKEETTTQYSLIRDYLAKRTYDESGDYSVEPFTISVADSLNDRIGNDGVFFDTEKTDEGATPSDDLLAIKASPGVAYVGGYDIVKTGTTILDVPKPRTTERDSNVSVLFKMGNFIRLNNVTGSPTLKTTISLYDRRRDSGGSPSGLKIGEARVYNFSLTDAPYEGANTSWDLYLFDLQTYTELVLNQSVTSGNLPQGSYVVGKSSGASGYATANGSGTTVFLTQTSGSFIEGEKLIINGVEDISRSILNIRVFGISDIKSVYQAGSPAFEADTLLSPSVIPGFSSQDTFIVTSGGQVTAPGKFFTGITTNSIVSYNSVNSVDVNYNRVSDISADGTTITLSTIESVPGVSTGTIAITGTENIKLSLRTPSVVAYNDGSLYVPLPYDNIASVNLQNSILTFKAQATNPGTPASGSFTVDSSNFDLPIGLSTAGFTGFDQERYSIHYSDGTIEPLSSDKFNLDIGNNQVTFNGITNTAISKINGTLIKSGIQSRVKIYNRSEILDISYSKYRISGTSTSSSIADSLTYHQIYGLRVQDNEICLNYPDVVKVLAVYESLNNDAPQFDQLTFSSIVNISNNSIIGEQIVGSTSGAVGRIIRRPSGLPNNLEFVYLNNEKFVPGEVVHLKETDIFPVIDTVIIGKYKNITNSFELDKAQKTQYYDYSRLKRKAGESEPTRKISVVFDYYSLPETDNGDVFTVLSYSSDRYSNDLPAIGPDLIPASDVLDFRPRVPIISNPGSLTQSPFNFAYRSFNGGPKVILAPDEVCILGADYYVPRIDKLFLDRQGNFIVKQGNPSLTPVAPQDDATSMLMATIYHFAYSSSGKLSLINLVSNRRYTMRDIGKIDNRVGNLERITTLSLLEVNTNSLQIRDADGLNRFKTGFFVDDFKDSSNINKLLSIIEVDPERAEMRPLRQENTLPNIPEFVTTAEKDPLSNQNIIRNKQNTIRFSGNQDEVQSLTLNYNSVDWIEQPIATQVENINPFHVIEYIGQVTLSPSEDKWVRTFIKLPDKIINRSNTINLTVNNTRTVKGGTIKKPVKQVPSNQFSKVLANLTKSGADFKFTGTLLGFDTRSGDPAASDGSRIIRSRVETVTDTTSSTSTSSSTEVVSSVKNLLSIENDRFMRSRNTEFYAVNLMPFARFYQFFDNQSGVKFIPKILEISSVNPTIQSDVVQGSLGTFIIGEDVIGYTDNNIQVIRFRAAAPNHKEGPHNSPSVTYGLCPYNKSLTLPSSYSSNLGYINIDTKSLSREAAGQYSGYVTKNIRLQGVTSGAVAWVSNVRLVSDVYGDLQGCFFLNDPNTDPAPPVRIETGTKTYKLTSSETNADQFPGSNEISYAETTYEANGLVENYQREQTLLTTNVVTTSFTTTVTKTKIVTTLERLDPLAQSFEVGKTAQSPQNSNINPIADKNGVYLTAVDVYFRKVDQNNSPVTIEIRTMELGTPTLTRIGEAVTLRPNQLLANGKKLSENVSEDASVATTVVFPYPIYLAADNEYALVLLAPESVEYEVFIAEMNKPSLNEKLLTGLPEAERVKYSKQFAIGSLFKSQNGSIWTADQNQDLKFKLYKAQFDPTGTAFFYNPVIDVTTTGTYFGRIAENSILALPRKIKLGITPTATASFSALDVIGRKFQDAINTSNIGFVEALGGPVEATQVDNAGTNYAATSGAQTYAITGNGSGLLVDIAVTNGGVTGATPVGGSKGSGYGVGDIVGIVTSSVSSSSGKGATFTVTSVTNYDTVFLTNVQGENFSTNQNFFYYDNSDVLTDSGINITLSTPIGGIYEGDIFKVQHFGHGMNSTTNKLEISGIESDIPTVALTVALEPNGSQISVASTADFENFEGIPVNGSNPGYLKIGQELIKYTGVTAGETIIGLTRNFDSAIADNRRTYQVGEAVMKYEFAGVSLRRINTSQDIADLTSDIDSYYVQYDRSSGPDRSSDTVTVPQLSFNTKILGGGNDLYITQNLMYDKITPSFEVYGPGSQVDVSASVRSVTSTSSGGNEVSFIDAGYQPVQINSENTFTTPRMVCSRVNELTYLTELTNSKSYTTAITLSTKDPNLSPQIFLDNAVTNFSISRLDNPVTDYVFDSRANQISDNSHASRYVSETIVLAQPATSLRVILTAYKHQTADFRVLYNTISADSYEIDQSFTLFPGYNNLTIDNNQDGFLDVVNPALNSGLPDSKVPSSQDSQFLEYEYTAANLKQFIGFTIKIVMSGSDQSKPPVIRDIRAIALA